MIPRYSRPEMSRLWSDENRFATWLRVEIAATEVLAEQGVGSPRKPWPPSRRSAKFDVARIDAIEREVQHDVIAFVSNVAENVGPEGRWIHYGLTSSDVVDTALAMLMRDACRPHPRRRDAPCATSCGARAHEFKDTPMIGRTHGVHAEPMTFGLKLALWYAELDARPRPARAAPARRSRWASSPAPWARSRTSPPEVEEAVCRAARPRARAGRLAGAAARPARRGDDRPGHHRRQPGEVRDRDPRPAEDRGARGRGAVRGAARRGRRPCPTSATPWAASRSPAWRASCAPTRWPRWRTSPCGTSATSATPRWSA